MLTEEEIKAIELEAERHYPISEVPSIEGMKTLSRIGYTIGATQERIKAKALIEALGEIKNKTGLPFIIKIVDSVIKKYNDD